MPRGIPITGGTLGQGEARRPLIVLTGPDGHRRPPPRRGDHTVAVRPPSWKQGRHSPVQIVTVPRWRARGIVTRQRGAPAMCGIVGYIGHRQATPILLEGLHRLEYRGYDSAGIAVAYHDRLRVTKAAVRVTGLRDLVGPPTPATIGIGHTRWATHGEPSDVNAHPHVDATGRIAVVHNGIIENSEQLRHELIASGTRLVSDTDTEALAHLIAAAVADGAESLEDAVRAALRRVEGTYGLIVLDALRPGELVVARNGSPIVLGVGEDEMFIASDVAALVRHTQRVVYLDDGELATVRAHEFRTSTPEARPTAKVP